MTDIWKAGEKVTPADLKAALEEAVACGADRAEMERQHAEMVQFYGSEEAFAAAWMRRRWQEAYEEELHPERWNSLASRPAPPRRSPGDRKRLVELIQQYPALAAEVLKDLPRPDH